VKENALKTAHKDARRMPTYRNSELAFSKYNNRPGTGGSGAHGTIPPNGGYDFYAEDELYAPATRAHGGASTEWTPLYDPTREEFLRDKEEAVKSGIPIGAMIEAKERERIRPPTPLRLLVTSMLHVDAEYGGPFWIDVYDTMRVAEVKKTIADKCGVMPGLMRLTYAGKKLDDNARTLAQMGVRYWNAKFPDWSLTMVR